MPNESLPTLSRPLLEQLRAQSGSQREFPPATMFNAPETVLLMGWGKFMRGYAPDFVQLANQDGRYTGRILAVQRSLDYRAEASARQDALYTLILRGLERGQVREVRRVIGAVSRLLVAARDWAQITAAVSKPCLRVILTNATETGLVLDADDKLESQPPRSFPGKLTQLLFARWRSTGGQDADIAVIPTELVLNNGPLVHGLILDQARTWNLGAEFLAWAQSSVHVASTLVDRIVVGTPRPELLAEECQAVGYRDDLLTCGETFYLFAITADAFTQRHFPMHLASPNVRYVDDLGPFRWRKLRVLNGPQMVLSTLGTLLGFRIVRESVADAQVGPFNEQTLWQEIIPAMGQAEAKLNAEYARECLERIGNPHIEHRLAGIRVDLTAKNAIRLIPSIRDYLKERDALPARLLLTMAATLEAVLRCGLEDVHAAYILDRWAAAHQQSPESLLTFTREALAHLSEQVHEPLDVDRVAPLTRDLLLEIRAQGLREVLTRRFGL
jgi:tagaturonate reductase